VGEGERVEEGMGEGERVGKEWERGRRGWGKREGERVEEGVGEGERVGKGVGEWGKVVGVGEKRG